MWVCLGEVIKSINGYMWEPWDISRLQDALKGPSGIPWGQIVRSYHIAMVWGLGLEGLGKISHKLHGEPKTP